MTKTPTAQRRQTPLPDSLYPRRLDRFGGYHALGNETISKAENGTKISLDDADTKQVPDVPAFLRCETATKLFASAGWAIVYRAPLTLAASGYSPLRPCLRILATSSDWRRTPIFS